MIRNLCLDGRRIPLAVELYGAALRICGCETAPRFAPLNRVRRICCRGQVQWAGEALVACAAHAVPVSFLARGRCIAHFLPTRPPAKVFGALLEDAVLHQTWREELENWVESEVVCSLSLVASRTKEEWGRPIRHFLEQGDARQALRAGIRVHNGAGRARRIWRCLGEYLYAWVAARLQVEDIPLACFGYSSDKPNLPEILARVLLPLLVPALAAQCVREAARRGPEGPIDGAGVGGLAHRCALAFDQAEPMLAVRLRQCLRRFERLVRDCAEDLDWRPLA